MWPWSKRWRDWAMHEPWPGNRSIPQPKAFHLGFEKAGLTLENQHIPWNAEAVLVEAQVRLPGKPITKADFTLRLVGPAQVYQADSLRPGDDAGQGRLFFRLPVPEETTSAELFWQQRSLGQLTLPVLAKEEFVRRLVLQMPTLYARLGDQTVACQSFVSTQCEGLFAGALLTSPTSLVPILDLGLAVEFHPEDSRSSEPPWQRTSKSAKRVPLTAHHSPLTKVPVQLNSSQMQSRQALLSVTLPKPRRMGAWQVTWMLGDVPLTTQRIRAISKSQFYRSLRITDTRFVMQTGDGEINLSRRLPKLETTARLGPCFLVSSSEPGMAGLCPLQVRAQVAGAVQSPLLQEQEVLITDGPSPFAPGTLERADLTGVTGFELRLKDKVLGTLPMTPAPTATFSSEGGFKSAADFRWSPAAEDQLKERLGKLLGERGGR